MRLVVHPSLFFVIAFIVSSCNTTGPAGLFTRRSPHELYGQKLTSSGLQHTALGKTWFEAAERSRQAPLAVTVPYKETGYFEAEKAQSAGLKFSAVKGQKIIIGLEKVPVTNFTVFMDLWSACSGVKYLSSADTLTNTLNYEIEDTGTYILTMQPELLSGGEYTLSINVGPSLGFPLKNKSRSQIQSFFGAERDAGTRDHEGVDIFSSLRTPVLAVAPGLVTAVNETALGGKVVWLKPRDKNYSLYYAHLDTQLVKPGQVVNEDDALGLMGNTGNARTTSPHLHFGIYTSGGAVDPLPYIIPELKEPRKVEAPLTLIGQPARTVRRISLYSAPDTRSGSILSLPESTFITAEAATANWYKVYLPDGVNGFLPGSTIRLAANAVKRIRLLVEAPLLDRPDSLAAKKAIIPAREYLNILAVFNNYYFVKVTGKNGWLNATALK